MVRNKSRKDKKTSDIHGGSPEELNKLTNLKQQELNLLPDEYRDEIHTLKDNAIDVLLWISHGNTTAVDQRYYPVENKFKGMSTFAKPLTALYTVELGELIQNPCQFLLGNCPTINHKVNERLSEAWLPPIVFSLPEINGPMHEYMGLYHFRIELVNLHGRVCNYIVQDASNNFVSVDGMKDINESKVLDNTNARQYYTGSFAQEYFTYSDIFKMAYDYCKEKNLNTRKVVMSIFSCFSSSDYLNHTTYQLTNLLLPKASKKVKQANIVSKNTAEALPLSLLILRTPHEFKDWTALAKQKSKGCGLNVLSYFGVIEQTEARNQTVCLSSKGTSIFKIVDIYDDTRVNKSTYVVVRTTLSRGIQEIFRFLYEFEKRKVDYNYGIVFKMYQGLLQANTNKDNHIGHTISIGIENTGNIFLFDPQSDKVRGANVRDLIIGNKNQLGTLQYNESLANICLRKIGDLFGDAFDTVDIILHDVSADMHSDLPRWQGVLNTNDSKTLVRQADTLHGGKRRKTHKHNKSNSKKMHRTSKRKGTSRRRGRTPK